MPNNPDNQSHQDRNRYDGHTIGKYRLLELINSGGRGEVYRAVDNELNREVALKILTESSSEQRQIAEYLAEARAAAAIKHPNIVTVYDAGQIDGHAFIAMELVNGQSLDAVIRSGSIDHRRALDIVRQISLGLKATHSSGIIHRDIKPANIIVEDGGRVCLLDFGIAASRQTDGGNAGEMSGTLAYMPPEQIDGNPLTPTADLYSVGVLLYELLTGKRPFEAEYEASLIYSILNEPAPSIRTVRPKIPEQIDRMAAKLLRKAPSERYQSADELLAEIDRALDPGDRQVTLFGAKFSRPMILLLSAAVLTLLIVYLIDKGPGHPGPAANPTRLVVLPFENRGASEDDYWVNGIAGRVAVQLSGLSGLRVVDRSYIHRKSTGLIDRDSICAEAKADYMLTGSVYINRSDSIDQLRVDAMLSRIGEDSFQWADSYVYELSDLFSVQSSIAKQVSNALRIRVPDWVSREQIPTTNLVAYDRFLKGNDYFFRSWDREDLSNAVLLYSQAVELDQEFALAYAMLSRGHESMYWEYYDRSAARCSLALAAANKALEIDSSLPEGKLAMAYYYYHCERDYNLALNEFQMVLSDRPGNSDLHGALGAVLRRDPTRLPEAIQHFKLAWELDPSSHLKAFDVGITYSMIGQYDSAFAYLDHTRLLEPGWGLVYIYTAIAHIFEKGDVKRAREIMGQAIGHADVTSSRYYWWLSRMTGPSYQDVLAHTRPGPDTAEYYLHKAQFLWLMSDSLQERECADMARVILERRVASSPDDPRYLSKLGLAYARLGEKKKAVSFSNKALELLPASRDAFDGPFVLFDNAETMMLIGEERKAIEGLNYMLSINGFITVPYLRVDPLWSRLRDDSLFQQLLDADKAGT